MASRYEVHIKSGGGGAAPPPPPSEVAIRDAHTIVVAQEEYLLTLSGVASPPMAQDNLNLSAGNGDVLNLTCDYLDPGDGSELQLALATAAAAGVPIDIRLRPCLITLTATTVGANAFSVPSGCRLIGAGKDISTLVGVDGTGTTTQCVVTLGSSATIEDCTVRSPVPVVKAGGTQRGVIQSTSGSTVRRCRVQLGRSKTADRFTVVGIVFSAPTGSELVEDVNLEIDTLFDQATPDESVGVEFGTATTISRTVTDPEVRNVTLTEFTLGAGSAARSVTFRNVEGGFVDNFQHIGSLRPSVNGALAWLWLITPGAPITTVVRGPRFVNYFLTALDDETSSQLGISIALAGTPNLGAFIRDWLIRDSVVRFLKNAVQAAGILKTGVRIANSSTDGTGKLGEGVISGCKIFAANRGFNIDTSGQGNGEIRSISISDCYARDPLAGNAVAPNGIVLRASGGTGSVSSVRITNCDFTGAPATGIGIEIEDASVSNTIVVANNLTPSGGTGLVDLGTNTQTGLNILV